jgi:hypothetical protein
VSAHGDKDTKLRLLPIAIATAGDDLRPSVTIVFQQGLLLQSGDIITAVNGGADVGTLSEVLAGLIGLGGEAIISFEGHGEPVSAKSPLNVVSDSFKARRTNFFRSDYRKALEF